MVEVKCYDLSVWREAMTMDFSAPNDKLWAGMIVLAPHAPLALNALTRKDVYVIEGSLLEHAREHRAGTFLIRHGATDLSAGDGGAVLFVYRDSSTKHSVSVDHERTVKPSDLVWYQPGPMGMQTATLSNGLHTVSLVSWQPGTRVGLHGHPLGEEIFVLKGELCDQNGRYPAGTWLRLHPAARHAPYAEIDTLILLRNGHLPG